MNFVSSNIETFVGSCANRRARKTHEGVTKQLNENMALLINIVLRQGTVKLTLRYDKKASGFRISFLAYYFIVCDNGVVIQRHNSCGYF